MAPPQLHCTGELQVSSSSHSSGVGMRRLGWAPSAPTIEMDLSQALGSRNACWPVCEAEGPAKSLLLEPLNPGPPTLPLWIFFFVLLLGNFNQSRDQLLCPQINSPCEGLWVVSGEASQLFPQRHHLLPDSVSVKASSFSCAKAASCRRMRLAPTLDQWLKLVFSSQNPAFHQRLGILFIFSFLFLGHHHVLERS